MHTLSFVLLNITSLPDGFFILLIALLLFGGSKIPQLMKGLGQGISEFTRAKNNLNAEIQEGVNQGMKQNTNQQQPTQNQSNTISTTGNPNPPVNTSSTDQLQKQIEQLQQQLNQLKQQQH